MLSPHAGDMVVPALPLWFYAPTYTAYLPPSGSYHTRLNGRGGGRGVSLELERRAYIALATATLGVPLRRRLPAVGMPSTSAARHLPVIQGGILLPTCTATAVKNRRRTLRTYSPLRQRTHLPPLTPLLHHSSPLPTWCRHLGGILSGLYLCPPH